MSGNKKESISRTTRTIGTRNESSLHKTLKFQYAGPGGKTEAAVGDYVADGISKSGEYIEVQTGSFAPLLKKIKTISANAKVRIIHPVIVCKILEVYDEKGVFLYRRKSPVKGTPWDLFDVLMYAPELALLKGVTIELILTDITEKRVKDGKGSWRRKGMSIKDKVLTTWHEKRVFAKKSDYLRFIPFKKGVEFTVSSLAAECGIRDSIARRALYVLTKIKAVKRVGKTRNAWVYTR